MTARIAELWLYPVKGCRGIALREAQLAPTGLLHDGVGDREWVVVDAAGRFLSPRTLPKMVLIETRLPGDVLRLKAPGMLTLEVPLASEGDVRPVQVWNDTIAAVTQGEVADAWFSNFLGVPCRLMRFDPEHLRLASAQYTGAHAAPYKFADAFPYLVTSRASLDDLNLRLAGRGAAAVGGERFRPNVVLEDVDPYEEDYARALRIDAARATLQVVKPCARCTVPGVDPGTGSVDPAVTDLLAAYRGRPAGVMFGVNAIALLDPAPATGLDSPAAPSHGLASARPDVPPSAGPIWPTVRRGDSVQVTLDF
jgi:hypothetical protein